MCTCLRCCFVFSLRSEFLRKEATASSTLFELERNDFLLKETSWKKQADDLLVSFDDERDQIRSETSSLREKVLALQKELNALTFEVRNPSCGRDVAQTISDCRSYRKQRRIWRQGPLSVSYSRRKYRSWIYLPRNSLSLSLSILCVFLLAFSSSLSFLS